MDKKEPLGREPERRYIVRPRHSDGTASRGLPQAAIGPSRLGAYGVAERWWHALRTGEGIESGFRGVAAILTAFVAADVPESVIEKVFLDLGNAGAAPFHSTSNRGPRPYSEAYGMLRRALNSKRRYLASDAARAGDHMEAMVFAASVGDAALLRAGAWRGKAGATDYAVLLALVGIASKAGRYEFHASVRTVAEEAGVGVGTACRSLARLLASRWLRRTSLGRGERASLYRLGVPPNEEGRKGTEHSAMSFRTTSSVPLASAPGEDTWRWRGLGKAAFRLYGMLGAEPATTATLAAMAGITTRAVRYTVATLARYGLANRTEDGWVRGEADPGAVGETLAVAGTGAEQRARHLADRVNRSEALRQGRPSRHRVHAGMPALAVLRLRDGSTVTVRAG